MVVAAESPPVLGGAAAVGMGGVYGGDPVGKDGGAASGAAGDVGSDCGTIAAVGAWSGGVNEHKIFDEDAPRLRWYSDGHTAILGGMPACYTVKRKFTTTLQPDRERVSKVRLAEAESV
mmetsp:Transcript_21584/g.56282  ORF Transcript_21584/g.56282 Transcript_21584/m.56282 type:complete len:119 (+) Transcript_21584:255-611(+)